MSFSQAGLRRTQLAFGPNRDGDSGAGGGSEGGPFGVGAAGGGGLGGDGDSGEGGGNEAGWFGEGAAGGCAGSNGGCDGCGGLVGGFGPLGLVFGGNEGGGSNEGGELGFPPQGVSA